MLASGFPPCLPLKAQRLGEISGDGRREDTHLGEWSHPFCTSGPGSPRELPSQPVSGG